MPIPRSIANADPSKTTPSRPSPKPKAGEKVTANMEVCIHGMKCGGFYDHSCKKLHFKIDPNTGLTVSAEPDRRRKKRPGSPATTAVVTDVEDDEDEEEEEGEEDEYEYVYEYDEFEEGEEEEDYDEDEYDYDDDYDDEDDEEVA